MINAQQAQKVIAGPLMGSGGGKLGTVQAVLANSSTGTRNGWSWHSEPGVRSTASYRLTRRPCPATY